MMALKGNGKIIADRTTPFQDLRMPTAFFTGKNAENERMVAPSRSVAVFSTEEASTVFYYSVQSLAVWGIRKSDQKAKLLANVADAANFFSGIEDAIEYLANTLIQFPTPINWTINENQSTHTATVTTSEPLTLEIKNRFLLYLHSPWQVKFEVKA